MKRGPKSQAELTVVKLADVAATRPRIAAPASLNAAERVVFLDVVKYHPHLKPGDARFLASYCMALVKADKIGRKVDSASVKAWEATMRIVIQMATKLRITQQAKTHHRSAGRAADNAAPMSFAERMQHMDDDE